MYTDEGNDDGGEMRKVSSDELNESPNKTPLIQ